MGTQKKLSEGAEPGIIGKYVINAIGDMDMQLKPVDTNDYDAVRERVRDYFTKCAENDVVPVRAGLCKHLGISSHTLNDWRTGYRRPDDARYRQLAQWIMDTLEELLVEMSLSNKVNNIAAIVQLKNFFGYTDEQKVIVDAPKSIAQDMSIEEVMQLASAETPKLAEYTDVPKE